MRQCARGNPPPRPRADSEARYIREWRTALARNDGARSPSTARLEWDALITEDVPSERIAWRSEEGSKLKTSGEVESRHAPGKCGTEVEVRMRYSPPAGPVGAIASKFLKANLSKELAEGLCKLKRKMETGELKLHARAS